MPHDCISPRYALTRRLDCCDRDDGGGGRNGYAIVGLLNWVRLSVCLR